MSEPRTERRAGGHGHPTATEPGAVRALAWLLQAVSAATLFALMCLTCADVFGRYLFNKPLTGSTELTELAVGAVVFSAFPLVSWRNQHIVVDILDRFVPPALNTVRSVLFQLLIAAGLVFIGERIIVLAERSLDYGEVTEFLAIPVGWMLWFFGAMCWLSALMVSAVGVHAALTARADAGNNAPAE